MLLFHLLDRQEAGLSRVTSTNQTLCVIYLHVVRYVLMRCRIGFYPLIISFDLNESRMNHELLRRLLKSNDTKGH